MSYQYNFHANQKNKVPLHSVAATAALLLGVHIPHVPLQAVRLFPKYVD